MQHNDKLNRAKNAKNDEFYTRYADIEAEVNAYVEHDSHVFENKTILCPCDDPSQSNFTKYFTDNFHRFGLKKLISTCYKQNKHGKLFIMTHDSKFSGYLQGDGDFRSEEVTALRDQADMIITNPPFSLFREFLAWIMDGKKQFVIIGNQNAITYKEVFPLLKSNEIWLGAPFPSGNAYFDVPADADTSAYASGVFDPVTRRLHFRNCRWFTNIDFGGRHEELQLMTMRENLKYNKKLQRKLEKDFGISEYPRYDNYDAIEVPYVECIPSDFDGAFGVPITYLDVHDPDQFEVVGADFDLAGAVTVNGKVKPRPQRFYVNGRGLYSRVVIRPKKKEVDA